MGRGNEGRPLPTAPPGAGRARRRMRRREGVAASAGAALLAASGFAADIAAAAAAATPAGAAIKVEIIPPYRARGGALRPGSLFPYASAAAKSSARQDRGLPLTARKKGLGDMVRSDSSTSRFFAGIDRDGDGLLERPEMESFIREAIGGTDFDTSAEVEAGVMQSLERLDRDGEEGLDRGDVVAYLAKFTSLLTADEVAEWIVHSVQLPEAVGQLFKDRHITGYDFMELVDHNGRAMEDELGIESASRRKKIATHINARLLGIGTVPSPPADVKHTLESCSTASLSWTRSTAKGFPVHSYRVQRRAISLEEMAPVRPPLSSEINPPAPPPPVCGASTGDADGQCVDPLPPAAAPTASSGEWTTVYVGGENELVDPNLTRGNYYIYRIQAWNSVGKSMWTPVDLTRSLKKQRCTTVPKPDPTSSRGARKEELGSGLVWSSPMTVVWFVFQFLNAAIRAVFALAAVGAAIMRYRRASALSSTSASGGDPVFPWLWNGMNKVSMSLIGYEVIPKQIIGDRKTRRAQLKRHDKDVKAVGLHGYERGADAPKERAAKPPPSVKNASGAMASWELSVNGSGRGQVPSAGKNESSRSEVVNTSHSKGSRGSKRNFGKRKFFKKSRSTGNLKRDEEKLRETSGRSVPAGDLPDRIVTYNKGVSMRSVITDESIDESIDESTQASMTPEQESDNICNTCHKSYKFPKRYKHHCGRCLETFCHKHGMTTHSNLVACRVPSDCVCNVCLNKEAARNRSRS